MSDAYTLPVINKESGFKLRTRKIRVEVVRGPDSGRTVALEGPEARVGSGQECDLRLTDRSVSRVHLTLRIEQDAIRVIDERSLNGTVLDGVPIRDAYARPDSLLVVGLSTLRMCMLDGVIELPLSSRDRFGDLLGGSAAMRRVFALLERLAQTDDTLLIEGETGTGKELAARAVHDEGPRAGGPFVVFDSSATAPNLIESDLFGHVRGAFTSAAFDRQGAFELADGGTLFIDEVGKLPLELQPKLLRALELHEVRRVGSNRVLKLDVRVVAATNRSLAREVELGRFLEDLYFRLEVFRVELPPLRERPEDVPLLVRHFERRRAPRSGQLRSLPDETVAELAAKTWRGNVRELSNAVARQLMMLDRGADGAPWSVPPPADEPPATLRVNLSEPPLAARERVAGAHEKAHLEAALRQSGGNVSRAAEIAQVSRKFVHAWMKRQGARVGGEGD